MKTAEKQGQLLLMVGGDAFPCLPGKLCKLTPCRGFPGKAEAVSGFRLLQQARLDGELCQLRPSLEAELPHQPGPV